MAWSLALLFLFKGLVCWATVAFPISSTEPVSLLAATGGFAMLASCMVWLLRSAYTGRRL